MRRIVFAECLGTFILIVAGTGAVVVNDVRSGMITHPGVALTWGLVVLALVYTVVGAHINPAVTIGLCVARLTPRAEVLPRIVGQVAGAFLGSGLLASMYPDHPTLGATLPYGPWWHAFVLEIFLTGVLVYAIISVAHAEPGIQAFAGVIFGAIIGLEALFAGPISGASMNPARSLAPAVVSGQVHSVWIYLTAPVVGAVLAVPLFAFTRPPLPLPLPEEKLHDE
jgi:aquaporin Z